ncbi:LysR family transcriptional regulator [Haliea sp. AH-315-K21]|uniref:LysR family transcriptional regulator n=1 Tax=SAR86 cluster bacterium TaxID=2030880 RepID=A0A2A5CGN1_9GAMM|nr:LysR family transcriptional regulator [Haliea sp. AH-315-K21]PCJ42903.1 MAG: LysR family transcriptional regulator [SAR86 cluster bacterium]
MFDLRKLRQFIAVAEELHFGKAAIRLHMSQPPLSRSIHQIEKDLQVELFVRHPHGVELTNEGEVFLNEARNILLTVERAYERTLQAKRGEIGRLVIGYHGSTVFDLLPRLIARFKQKFPQAQIDMHNMNKNEQLLNLRNHSIHIGIIRHVNDEPGITTHIITKEPIYVAVSNRHSLATAKSIAMKSLATEPLIVFPQANRPSFADQTISECRKSGFIPNVVQETEDAVSALVLVSAGLGISLVPHSACNIKIPDVTFIPLNNPKFRVELCCIHLTERRAPVLEAFLQIIKNTPQ